MRLADFIFQNRAPIIAEWEAFASTLDPAVSMTRRQLRDHIEEILSFISKDLKTTQTKTEQVEKSHGKSDNTEAYTDTAAEAHGTLRHSEGFDMVEMVSEYRALRCSVVKLWTASERLLDHNDVQDLTRFNEAIDQALAESVIKFTAKVDYSRDLLLGVLGHDLRSPLGAITIAGELLPMLGPLSEKQLVVNATLQTCSQRMAHIISDLLDLARARQGTGLPVNARPMDLGVLAKQMVAETLTQNPDRDIALRVDGDVIGEWDETRLGQTLSNLLSNAVQYGEKTKPIKVSLEGRGASVALIVHNEGAPIPPEQLKNLFLSFSRGTTPEAANAGSNLGLGLFIVSEIVKSHDGKIDVTSSADDGTAFTVTLPRKNSKTAD